MIHKYPQDLVRSLQEKWLTMTARSGPGGQRLRSLPETAVLEDLVSTCYQASHMQEEQRDIRFRLMLADPEDFDGQEGVLQGMFTLKMTEPIPYNTYELLKLAPALNFNNTLIGVRYRENEGLQIWGVIHSGSRWVQVIHGGSKQATPLPDALGINVAGPGRLLALCGLEIMVQLAGGRIISPSMTVFQADWMNARFNKMQEQLASLHAQNPLQVKNEWAKIDPSFVGRLYLEFFKHLLSTVRRSGHGGTILSFPAGMENIISRDNPYIAVRYRFSEGGASSQLKLLILEIMQALATICGRLYGPDYVAGWDDYVSLQGKRLAQLDEQVFKYARFVAWLTGVDGAVVTTEGPELIGFGGIIQGNYEMGQHIAKALDPEGRSRQIERIESVGTRHRSCYYLCKKLQSVLAIVVSQDDKVRAVTWGGDTVLYWDVIPIDFAM
ncbi:MAG: putative sensor domain DACNV-containing protein [Desulfopila sp.]